MLTELNQELTPEQRQRVRLVLQTEIRQYGKLSEEMNKAILRLPKYIMFKVMDIAIEELIHHQQNR